MYLVGEKTTVMLRGRIHLISIFGRDVHICRSLLSSGLFSDGTEGVRNSVLKAETEDENIKEDGPPTHHSLDNSEGDEYSPLGPDNSEVRDCDSSNRRGAAAKKPFVNRQKKQSVCLPTVFLPAKLQEAIEVVLSSEFKTKSNVLPVHAS